MTVANFPKTNCPYLCYSQVSGLCYLMDHTYTRHQLLRMERKVLCGLKFDLSYTPPLHFLLLLAAVARCSAKVALVYRLFSLSNFFICVSFNTLIEVFSCLVCNWSLKCRPTLSTLLSGGMDGSLPAWAVSPGGSVCGVSACAAGRSNPLLVPPSPAGALNTRGGGCLVPGLQHPCRQVCI